MECLIEGAKDQAARVEQLRLEWKRLWREYFGDRVRAEGVASNDYSTLSIEKGTVIFAARNFKLLTLNGILEEHGISDAYRFVGPSPMVGGWGKFIKNSFAQGKLKHEGRRRIKYFEEQKKPQRLRKGGRGWLHV